MMTTLRLNFVPLMTLIVLIAMSLALPNGAQPTAEAAQRKIEVAQAIDLVPLFLGKWVGEEVPVPPEAQKLLRPNAVMSRTYQADGEPIVRVLMVHCGDARDMIGHYPPICYPSAGWMESPVPNPDAEVLDVNGRHLPVRTYMFRHQRDSANEEVIRIFNAFILPDGQATRDIDDIHHQSERLAVSTQGVAQVQLITSGRIDRARAATAASELLSGMTSMFDALRLRAVPGEGEDHD